MSEPFLLEDATGVVYQVPKWLNKKEANSLFKDLLENAPWPEQPRWNAKFNCFEPRISLAIGEPLDGQGNPIVHKYSGTSSRLVDWNSLDCLKRIKELRDRIEEETGFFHDSASLQYYRNGHDYIAEHADLELKLSRSREYEIEPTKTVYALSLGATRRFYFKRNETGQRYDLEVANGDMLAMEGLHLQKTFKHALPKMTSKLNPVGPRISVTWRLLGEY